MGAAPLAGTGRQLPLVGRGRQLRRLRSAMERGSSVVVVGAAGTGKTRLVQDTLATIERPATLLVGTDAAREIALGAFAPALPDELPTDPFDRLRAAGRWLSSRTTLLIVDDAHLLDPTSTTLVQQLISGGVVTVVVTVRSDSPDDASLAAQWGPVESLHLDGLDRAATEALARAALDGPLTPRTADTIWERTRGNPLAVGELLRVAVDLGAIRRTGGIWRLDAEVTLPRATAELIATRIRALESPQRDAFELIAIGEPVPLGALDRLGIQAATEVLEEQGLVAVADRGGTAWVQPQHPLHGGAVRGGVPPVRRVRHLRALASIADLVADHDPIRAARWQLEAGVSGDPELLRRAAIAARGVDRELARKLATAAATQAPTSRNLAVLAQTVLTCGDPHEALTTARQAAAVASDDHDRAELAVMILRWLVPHPALRDAALRVVGELTGQLVVQDAIDLVETELAVGAAASGARDAILPAAGRALDRPGSAAPTVVAAATERLMFELFGGRTDGVEQELGRLTEVAAGVDDPFHRGLLGAARSTWSCLVGRIDDAVTHDRAALAAASQAAEPTGQLLASMWLAVALELSGGLREALGVLLDVEPMLAHTEPYALRHFHPAVTATVRCQLGDQAEAQAALAGLPPAARDDRRVRAWVARAQAWLTATAGDLATAAGDAIGVADELAAHGWLVYAAFLHFDVVRLGRPQDAREPLRSICDHIDGSAELLHLMAAHADAAAAADGDALDHVADRWGAAGARLFAAEAAGNASIQHARAGYPDRAARSASRAGGWAAQCPGARTPGLAGWRSPLTDRERQVALLAAGGPSSREIAERLVVSVRTVDNHLASVYRKLGIAGRDELATALGLGEAPPPGPVEAAPH